MPRRRILSIDMRMGAWQFRLALMSMAILLARQAVSQKGTDSDFDTVLHRAFELHQRARYDESLPLLRQAFRLQPNDYFVNLLLGIDLLRSGRASDAIPFLRTAARLRPKEEFPREYLGESHAHLAQFPEAAQAFLAGMQVAPSSEQAITAFVDFSLERIRQISMELRSTREGLAAEYRIEARADSPTDPGRARLLQQSAELDPEAPGIWSELALANVVLDQFADAERELENAAAANPNDLVSVEAKAVHAAKIGAWQDAASYLNGAARRSPSIMKRVWRDWPRDLNPPSNEANITGPARTLFSCIKQGHDVCDFATESISQQQPRSAASAATLFREQRWELLAHQPQPNAQDHESWALRGIALAETGDCLSAVPALENARESKTHRVQALYSLSICYSNVAGDAASRAEGSQDDEMMHVLRGDIFLRLRADSHAALTEYQFALAKQPNDPSILERVAEAQLAAAQNDAARQSAEAALRIDPERASAKRTLAKLLMQERDYAGALPYLRALIAQDQKDLASRIELGTALAQTGDYNDAVQTLAPLLEQGYPDQKGTLHYLLGTALRKLGRNQEAEAAFSSAHALSDRFQHGSLQDSE